MPENRVKEIRQVIKKLCMMHNKFLNAMLDENIPAAQRMLQVILEDDKIKVIDVRIQNFIQNLYGHSAQLDILAQDGEGRFFNVEVQRSDEGAHEKRARFYSSVLDTHFLQSNHDYKELPESYVIFITENDVLQKNLPLYHIDRTIREDRTDFADGAHIVYVNSKIRDDTQLGKLMQDLYCTDPKNLHYQEFAERMEFLKYSKEVEATMVDPIEEYAEKRAKEAAHQKSMEIALRCLNKGYSVEDAAEISELPFEEVRAIARQQSA